MNAEAKQVNNVRLIERPLQDDVGHDLRRQYNAFEASACLASSAGALSPVAVSF
jgi:hypothetical protein